MADKPRISRLYLSRLGSRGRRRPPTNGQTTGVKFPSRLGSRGGARPPTVAGQTRAAQSLSLSQLRQGSKGYRRPPTNGQTTGVKFPKRQGSVGGGRPPHLSGTRPPSHISQAQLERLRTYRGHGYGKTSASGKRSQTGNLRRPPRRQHPLGD